MLQKILQWEKEIIVVGALDFGATVLACITKMGKCVPCVCDNNRDLQGSFLMQTKIVSIEQAVKKYPHAMYVLCVFTQKAEAELKAQLKDAGAGFILHGRYFLSYYQSEYLERGLSCVEGDALYERLLDERNVVLYDVPISITERCSLKCKNCSFLINYRKDKTIGNIQEIAEDITKLAGGVDIIKSINIIGGEVFTFTNGLIELLQRISSNKKILQIKVVTNGTILPSYKELEEIRKYISCIEISDYGLHSKKKQELCRALDEMGIPYRLIPEDRMWFRINEIKDYHRSENEIKEIFDSCGFYSKVVTGKCTPLHKGRLYRCAMAAYGTDIWQEECVKEIDAVDVRSQSAVALRQEIQRMLNREAPLKMCQFCGVDVHTLVLPAEQDMDK